MILHRSIEGAMLAWIDSVLEVYLVGTAIAIGVLALLAIIAPWIDRRRD